MTNTPTLCPCCGNILQVRWPFIYHGTMFFGTFATRLAPVEQSIMNELLKLARLDPTAFIRRPKLAEIIYNYNFPRKTAPRDVLSGRITVLRQKLRETLLFIQLDRRLGYRLIIQRSLDLDPNSRTTPRNRQHNVDHLPRLSPKVLP